MKRLGIALAAFVVMTSASHASEEMTFEEFRDQCRKPSDIYSFCSGYIVGMASQLVAKDGQSCFYWVDLKSMGGFNRDMIDTIVKNVMFADLYSYPKEARIAVEEIIRARVCRKK